MSYLIDYVPAVHAVLQERVEAVIHSYIQRKEYTAACLSIMGKSVLEYNTEDFKTLSFFFESQGFSFISHCKCDPSGFHITSACHSAIVENKYLPLDSVSHVVITCHNYY